MATNVRQIRTLNCKIFEEYFNFSLKIFWKLFYVVYGTQSVGNFWILNWYVFKQIYQLIGYRTYFFVDSWVFRTHLRRLTTRASLQNKISRSRQPSGSRLAPSLYYIFGVGGDLNFESELCASMSCQTYQDNMCMHTKIREATCQIYS